MTSHKEMAASCVSAFNQDGGGAMTPPFPALSKDTDQPRGGFMPEWNRVT